MKEMGKERKKGRDRKEGKKEKCITVLFRTEAISSPPFSLFWLVLSLHPARIENPHSKEM